MKAIQVSGKDVAAELAELPKGAQPNSRRVVIKLTADAKAEPGLREM